MGRIRVRNAVGSLQTVKNIKIRDATNVLRNVVRIRMRDATNTLRTIFDGFTVTANTPVTGTAASSPVTSSASTVTVSGGVAPYTYLWRAYQDDAAAYNPHSISILSPTSNSTTFRRSMIAPDVYDGFFECEVTDALGNVMVTNMVVVTLTRT